MSLKQKYRGGGKGKKGKRKIMEGKKRRRVETTLKLIIPQKTRF